MLKSIIAFIKRRWYLALAAFLIVGFIVVRANASKKPALTFTNPTIETIEETIEVSGNVTAKHQARLKFLAGGKLTYLGVNEGDEVKKNQRLASIDTRDLQKNLKSSLNSYLVERADLEEGRYDNKDVPMTDSVIRSLNQLQWTMDNAVLDVELRDLAIRNASLYSPFAGIVTSVPTNIAGMQVTATDVFEVVDPSTLEFAGEVDEIDIGRIKLGQNVHIVLDAYLDDTTDSQIEQIALKATNSTKASGGTVFIIRAKLPPEYLRYRLGMNGSMKVVVDQADQALTVPLASVTERDGKSYVQVKSGNKAVDREVETGIENDERVQILSGLSQSDEIVEVK